MIDKMRGEFEIWAISSAWLGLGEESQMERDESGEGYNEIEVHTAWLSWQASRASIEVELPEARRDQWGYQLYTPNDVVGLLKSLGLKVKA